MIGDRQETIRRNITRFEQLLSVEADPTRRVMLTRLLREVRAELEFLIESGQFDMEKAHGTVTEERTWQFRRKALECRSVARSHDNQSTREVFHVLAKQYETLVSNAESTINAELQCCSGSSRRG